VLSWGCGDHGQLGHGDEEDKELPTVIAGLQAQRMVQLAAGERHVLALTDTSLLFAWGSNSHGQLGSDVPVGGKLLSPQVCAFGEREAPQSVAAGRFHSAALVSIRRVDNRAETVAFCWGDATRQQLGGADPRRCGVF
jgi:alpha-tubulin suppressor-like RCC1 family protein